MYGMNSYGWFKTINGMQFAMAGIFGDDAPPPKPAPIVRPESQPLPEEKEAKVAPEPKARPGDAKALERTKVRKQQKSLATLLGDEDQGTTII